MKIFDCFLYNGEATLLNLRLHELYDTVDLFVICESTYTFTGKPKELTFSEKDFPKFKDKIRYLPHTELPVADAWTNESNQRNFLATALVECQDDDIIILSDVDEIPDIAVLRAEKATLPFSFRQDFYYYNLNCRFVGLWAGTAVVTKAQLDAFGGMQNVRMKSVRNQLRGCRGGWHFSYFGDIAYIQKKLTSFSHTEFSTGKYVDASYIEDCIRKNVSLFAHGGDVCRDKSNYLPRHVQLLGLPMFYDNWYSDDQIHHLVGVFEQARALTGLVVEIGCWEGKSTVALANACHPETLYCNDTWLGNQAESKLTGALHPTEAILKTRDVFAIFTNNMDTSTKGNYSIIKKDCMLWLRENTSQIKFCHIDASHDYYSVKETLELIKPMIVDGGILCGDDFLTANKNNLGLAGGVERAVREMLPSAVNIGNFWYWKNIA